MKKSSLISQYLVFCTQFQYSLFTMLLPWLFKDMRFGIIQLGPLFAAMNAGVAFLKVPLGYIFDKVSPKPMFSFACLSMLTTSILVAYVEEFYSTLLILSVWSIGYSILSLYTPSFYSLNMKDKRVGRLWGFFNALLYLGYFLGPLFVGVLLHLGLSAQVITAISGLPFGLGVFLVFLLGHPTQKGNTDMDTLAISIRDIAGTFYRIWIWTFIVSLAWGSLAYYIPLITDQLCIDRVIVSLLYTVTSFLAVCTSIAAGEITDTLGVATTLILGQLMGLAEVVFLLVANDLTLVSLAFITGGLYVMTDTAINTFITKSSAKKTRGRSFGTYSAFSGLGWMLGPLLGALLWSTYSYHVLLSVCSIFLAIGLVLGYIATGRQLDQHFSKSSS